MAKERTETHDTEGLIRIGELARRAGVARGTIQHYVREGLLPKPIKTFRNMAYYKPEWVERIQLIKELQSRSHLPLTRIREMLSSDSDLGTLAESVAEAQDAALNALTPAARGGSMTVKQAAMRFGLRPKVVEALRELGIVSTKDDGAAGNVFTGADLEVLATVGKLSKLGFNEENGFYAKDLLIYRDALETLIHREVQTFMRVLASHTQVTPELARAAVDGATLLLLAMRKKSVADYLSGALAQLGPRDHAPSGASTRDPKASKK